MFLKQALTSKKGQELLLGKKTDKKISGDIGEFLVGVLIQNLFTEKELKFVGDETTSFGHQNAKW